MIRRWGEGKKTRRGFASREEKQCRNQNLESFWNQMIHWNQNCFCNLCESIWTSKCMCMCMHVCACACLWAWWNIHVFPQPMNAVWFWLDTSFLLGQLSTYESAPNLSDEHNVEGKYSLAKPGGPSRCVNCAGRKWWKTATMIATLAYTICATTL